MNEFNCKNFKIITGEETFTCQVNGLNWFTLPVRSAVDTAEKTDIDETFINYSEQEQNGIKIVKWTTASNIWNKKEYVLKIMADSFLYSIVLTGNGAINKIRYFSNGSLTRYETSGYVLPLANHTNKAGNTRTIMENSQISLGYAAPTMYVFPFFVEEEPGSFGLGLVAKAGEYNFDVFNYKCAMQFELPLYNRTVVNGTYETQSIWGSFEQTEEDILKAYTEWHFNNGYASRHTSKFYDWWKKPIFCGWGEQAVYYGKNKQNYERQSAAATQKNYTEMLNRLEKENLNPGTIIIDAKWQTFNGTLEVNKDLWPNLRGFVDEQHSKGRKVLLWMKSWESEGLPETECTRLLTNAVSTDPTNPKYIERIKKQFRVLLSSEEGCCNCDGFKIDFVNCIPSCEGSSTYGNICGVELIKAWMKLVYDTVKSIKPDGLVNTSCAHPYFTENVDMPRIHDYHSENRSCVSIMGWRKTIFSIANPNAPVDMVSGGIGSKRDFQRYMKYQAEVGVPTLYWLNATDNHPLENVPFDKDDYDCIRECWKNYEEKLK